MQKVKLLIALLFVSITMTLGACAEDETLTELENIEMTDGGDDDPDGGMGESNGGGDDDSDGGM